MSPLEFLSTVWGADDQGNLRGTHFIAVSTLNGWRHYAVSTLAESIAKAREFTNAGHNVYFACATYHTEAGGRNAANAAGAGAFGLTSIVGHTKPKAIKATPRNLTR